jgi:UDP-GlcNAc:undecaprenyl-phosphate GlcNAc-1-phosphate transferase
MNNSIITTLFFCLAVLLVFDFIWLLLKTPIVFFFKDKPGTRKIHQQTIPRAGGICIAVSFCIMILFWKYSGFNGFPQLSTLFLNVCLIITIGIFLIGFFDDTTSFVILNKAKFLFEFLIAAEVVFLFGIHFKEINFFGLFFIRNEMFLHLFSIFWMVGIANALNIIDGIDGLAGTFSIISFLTIALLAMYANVAEIAILSIIIAGCTIGFLIHNISPARVFLGDTGSLLLGMLLSLFLMYMVAQPNQPFSINAAVLIVGYPILDVSVAMARRFFKAFLSGKGLFQSLRAIAVADSDHTHHRLIYRGLSHTQATLIIATLSATLCVAAVHVNLFMEFKYAIIIYMLLVVSWFLYELNFFDRTIVYIRIILRHKTRKMPYKIGVIDADPVLHHALIHFPQRKFIFEFISQQELATVDAIQKKRLQSVRDSDDQFIVSETWATDTRKISKKIINEVVFEMRAHAREEGQIRKETAEHKIAPVYRSSSATPHLAMVVNCRDVVELNQKKTLVVRLLQEMKCAVIIVTDQIPDSNGFPCELLRQLIFVKKPFYVPVFFKELFQLAKRWAGRGSAGILLRDALILKTIAE